jgi:hypothetical protein
MKATLAKRIGKIEEVCKGGSIPSVERARAARIKIAEMILQANEADLVSGNALSERPEDEPAERAVLQEECSELRQEIADLKAGRFDAEIAKGFSQPPKPFDGAERARRGIAMLCKGEAEHERRLNFWRAKLADQGAGNVA